MKENMIYPRFSPGFPPFPSIFTHRARASSCPSASYTACRQLPCWHSLVRLRLRLRLYLFFPPLFSSVYICPVSSLHPHRLDNFESSRHYIHSTPLPLNMPTTHLTLPFLSFRPPPLTIKGEHYRTVIQTPKGSDHGNIRNLLSKGWRALSFPDGLSLRLKK